MPPASPRLDLVLAEWVLRRIRPEEVVRCAVQALEAGCEEPGIAVIAGLDATTRIEIEDELPRLLRALNARLPSEDAALKTLVDECARQIAQGETDPVQGAWAMWAFSANEDESPEFFEQVRLFVGLASECDTPGPHVQTHRAQIVQEARAFLDGGGLRIPA